MAKKAKAKARKQAGVKAVRPAATSSYSKESGVGYWKIIKDSLKFSFSFDKVALAYVIALPFLFLYLWFLYALTELGNNLSSLLGANPNPNPSAVAVILGPFILMVGYMVIYFFLITLLNISIVSNANSFVKGSKKSVFQSIKETTPKFWSAVGAMILMVLLLMVIIVPIMIIASLLTVPSVGLFLALLIMLIVFLMFLFVLPIIVLENKGIIDSYKVSYATFITKPWKVVLAVLSVFFVYICLALIGKLISLPFTWPVDYYSWSMSQVAAAPDMASMLIVLKANFLMYSIGIFIAALVGAYSLVFMMSAIAFFYLRIRKL